MALDKTFKGAGVHLLDKDTGEPYNAGATVGGATAANQATEIVSLAAIASVEGVTTGAAVSTDANGTVQQYLRGLVKLVVAKIGIVVADGDLATLGAKADAASTATDTTAISAMSVLKQISKSAQALVTPAGTRIEGTIASGATAQAVFGQTPANGFEIINPHASEKLYIRESASAATVADNSFNTAIEPGGSYMTPPGYKPGTDVSIIATTTSHAYIARRW